jgi:hypothetical protein
MEQKRLLNRMYRVELYDLVLRDVGTAPPARRSGGITARDLLVILAVAAKGRHPWSAAELARELALPYLDVSMALERARRVGLMDAEKRRAHTEPLLELLAHGARFVFPAEVRPRGIVPLDEAAIRADDGLRAILGLVDVLRAGNPRERVVAARELAGRLDATLSPDRS